MIVRNVFLALLSCCVLCSGAVCDDASDGKKFVIWANNGEYKVPQEDMLAAKNGMDKMHNTVWNGTEINLFAAKNEVVAFNVIVEAPETDLKNLSFQLHELSTGSGYSILDKQPSKAAQAGSFQGDNTVFDYTARNIESFVVRYLPIKGLSKVGYDSSYDERHIPQRFRRPFNNNYQGIGGWEARPDHDKSYPDIAVPQMVYGAVNVAKGHSQSVWFDIYVPKDAPAGMYTGQLIVLQSGEPVQKIPVNLKVRDFLLPDVPSAKTMLYLGYADISKRYLGGEAWGEVNQLKLEKIRDRHFQMAHRHRISLVDDDEPLGQEDKPNLHWMPRLNGKLFTQQAGYDGPGTGIGNDIYAIGMYGKWDWGQNDVLSRHAENWQNWFKTNAPSVEHFLFLVDESDDYPKTEKLAKSIKNSKGLGSSLLTFATVDAPIAMKNVPSLDIAASTRGMGITSDWQKAKQYFTSNGKKFWMYNGSRPMSGSFVTDDDGVALRELAWVQYKLNIERWFYWESTYYNNYQGDTGQTDVFKSAHTFGARGGRDASLGESGWNYSNGDGVLFYPGTDRVYPNSSYGLEGPIASLRLKYWRRGLQDVDYLTMAAKIAPDKVRAIVSRLVPKALWEYGVSDPSDPTWVKTDVSWSNDPDVWEKARMELADIIEKR